MKFQPYQRTSQSLGETYRFLGARVLIPFVVERGDVIAAVEEELEQEETEPTSRSAVERLVRQRLQRYGEFAYEGDSDDCYERAVQIVDRLFPELIEYETRHNEPRNGGTTA